MPWFVVLVIGVSIVALLAIVVPLSRRVRGETGLDPELEARVLLGDPPPTFDDPDVPVQSRAHSRDYDPGEISALRRIGEEDQQPRRRLG